MKAICAWCGRTLKERDGDQLEVLVSHGIWASCAAKVEIGAPSHGLEEAPEDGQLEALSLLKYACSL